MVDGYGLGDALDQELPAVGQGLSIAGLQEECARYQSSYSERSIKRFCSTIIGLQSLFSGISSRENPILHDTSHKSCLSKRKKTSLATL